MPEDEGTEDFSPFTDLPDDGEEINEEQEEDEGQDDGEDDVEMITSSEEQETEMNPEEEDQTQDDLMGETQEDEPDAKRRKIVKMIESIPSTAKDEGICLACGNTGHSMSDCENKEDIDRVSSAFDVILPKKAAE